MLFLLFTFGTLGLLARGLLSYIGWILFYLLLGAIALSLVVHGSLHALELVRRQSLLQAEDLPPIDVIQQPVPSGRLLPTEF